MSVSLPTDEEGRIARECPNTDCSPGYFKVKPGTGMTGLSVAYCPYCKHAGGPDEFATEEQVRYATDSVVREAHKGVDAIVKNAIGLGSSGKRQLGGGLISIEVTYKPGSRPPVRPPYEDEVRRDVVCPHCRLDQTVFGLATWCADCARDIFLSHLAAELEVVGLMVGDVQRRGELLGKRVVAKDLENCLEDIVSIFEAAMKAVMRRALQLRGEPADAVDARIDRLGNAFQNIARTRQTLADVLGYAGDALDWGGLAAMFEKRNPIAHNLGVVDRKFLRRTQADEQQGRELRVDADEVRSLIALANKVIGSIYTALVGTNV
jgi:hypothetical protein